MHLPLLSRSLSKSAFSRTSATLSSISQYSPLSLNRSTSNSFSSLSSRSISPIPVSSRSSSSISQFSTLSTPSVSSSTSSNVVPSVSTSQSLTLSHSSKQNKSSSHILSILAALTVLSIISNYIKDHSEQYPLSSKILSPLTPLLSFFSNNNNKDLPSLVQTLECSTQIPKVPISLSNNTQLVDTNDMELASYLSRLTAFLIDNAVVTVIGLLGAVLSSMLGINKSSYQSAIEEYWTFENNPTLSVIIGYLNIVVYDTLLLYFNNGQTIGKALMKIKVIRTDFQKMDLQTCIKVAASRGVFIIFFSDIIIPAICNLFPSKTPFDQGQLIHNWISDTNVVRIRKQPKFQPKIEAPKIEAEEEMD
jgi:uncharacterized RDD family membrane protein YckC